METKSINGRYEARERIGSGGMANVYKGIDCVLKRDVAIKLLHDDSASDPSFVERFRREAQAVARLNHPNIVSVYDWGAVDHSYYMVMEYVDGTSLKEIIRDRAPLPEREALRIAADVASALAVAHQGGIVHRDIKPQNILLTWDGAVKVVDFGIARTESLTQLTLTNAVYGTAHYFSPEQAQGRTVDARSDIYSLGVVLYEMLTGREPFQGASLLEVAVQHVQQPPMPPRDRVPSISPEVNDLVLRALAKDPNDRFATANGMRIALVGAMAEASVEVAERTKSVPVVTASNPPTLAAPRRGRNPLPLPMTATRQRDRSPWGRILFVVPVLFVALAALLAQHTLRGSRHAALNPHATPTSGYKLGTHVQTHRPTIGPRRIAARARGTGTNVAVSPHAVVGPPPRTSRAATNTPTVVVPTVPMAPTSLPNVSTGSSGQESTAAAHPDSAANRTNSSSSAAVQAVDTFYRAVSAHHFSQAQNLWTPAMIANNPPATNLSYRFASVQSMTVISDKILAYDPSSGTASVSVDLLEQDTGSSDTVRYRGTWNLVDTADGWKLDSPHLYRV